MDTNFLVMTSTSKFSRVYTRKALTNSGPKLVPFLCLLLLLGSIIETLTSELEAGKFTISEALSDDTLDTFFLRGKNMVKELCISIFRNRIII